MHPLCHTHELLSRMTARNTTNAQCAARTCMSSPSSTPAAAAFSAAVVRICVMSGLARPPSAVKNFMPLFW